MQILYEITAYEVEPNDVISFIHTEHDEDDTYIINEIMIVLTSVDTNSEIVVKGESLVTGEMVQYNLDPDFVVNFLGE